MSWNIKTPGDYINGPLTVAGVTQFNSNVGVGIAPAVNLHVASSGNTQFRIESTGTTAGATNRLQFKNASGALDVRSGVIEWYDVNTFKGDFRLLKAGGIQIRNSSDSPTFNLEDSGNLGVGLTASAYKISAAGFIAAVDPSFSGTGGSLIGAMLNNDNTAPGLDIRRWTGTAGIHGTTYIATDSSGATFFYNGQQASNTKATALRLTLGTGGLLALNGGNAAANGVGIAFPSAQSASTDANTLDDYEEGTWIPTIIGNSGATGQSYTTQAGRYTKVGRQVTLSFEVQLSTKGTLSGGYAVIGNLPFTPAGANLLDAGSMAIGYAYNFATSFYLISGYAQIGQNIAYLTGNNALSTNPISNIGVGDVSNTTRIAGTLTYTV